MKHSRCLLTVIALTASNQRPSGLGIGLGSSGTLHLAEANKQRVRNPENRPNKIRTRQTDPAENTKAQNRIEKKAIRNKIKKQQTSEVIARDDVVTLPSGTEEAFIGVLENDTGDNLSIAGITIQPASGTCAISLNLQEVVYSPPSPGFSGTDECDYEVCNLEEVCDQATLRVIVGDGGGNDTPQPTLADTPLPTLVPTVEVVDTIPPSFTQTRRPTRRPTVRPVRPDTPFPTEVTGLPTYMPTGGDEDKEEYGSYSYNSYDTYKSVDGYINHFSSGDDSKTRWSGSSSGSSGGSWSSGSKSGKSKSGKSSKGSKGSSGSWSESSSSSADSSWDHASWNSSGGSGSSGGSWGSASSGKSGSGSSGGSWDSRTYRSRESRSYHHNNNWNSSSGRSWSGGSGSSGWSGSSGSSGWSGSSSGKSKKDSGGKTGKRERNLRH